MEVTAGELIADRIRLVLSKIRVSADKVGRDPRSVRLVAATKTVDVERVQAGINEGLSILGENRVQEALPKIAALKQTPVQWHFLGQLQRRKVRSIIGLFDLIHSVDSLELAREIDRRAGESGKRQDILLEVNIGNESTKAGFGSGEIFEQMLTIATLPHVRVRGLMAIPPLTAEPELARRYFVELREIAQHICARRIPGIGMDELSMGMSNDYEIAVEEGATLVRIGSAIFGARDV